MLSLCVQHRADLIDCCLASSHVPFLLDWRASALCRGRQCVDGSMLYILTGWVCPFLCWVLPCDYVMVLPVGCGCSVGSP